MPTFSARNRPRRIATVVAVIALVAAAAGALARTSVLANSTDEVTQVIMVPFVATGMPPDWSSEAFAQAMADRLETVAAVRSRVGTGREADSEYIIEGEATGDGKRLTIAVRVRHAHQRVALWSATFWRESLSDSTLTTDLATAVADAVRLPRTQPRRDVPPDSAIQSRNSQ